MSAPIMTCAIPYKVTPCQRVVARDFSPRAKSYHRAQRDLASLLSLTSTWHDGARLREPIDYPVRLGVAVMVEPTRKGVMPKTCGDWDNMYKAVADALQWAGILANDHAQILVGPGDVMHAGGRVQSGVYLSRDAACTLVTLWAS